MNSKNLKLSLILLISINPLHALSEPLFTGQIIGSMPDEQGTIGILSRGTPDRNSPFFQNLGTNGRTCLTCHQPGNAFSISPEAIQDRFDVSNGQDSIFHPNDGSDCENVDPQDPLQRRAAYSMLLNHGLIRVGIAVPAGAEFSVTAVDDPHHCAESAKHELSFYRRPLPTTNLTFISSVMWDGRELSSGQTVREGLLHQAMDATLGHAQGAQSPTQAQLNAIVNFETSMFTAQNKLVGGELDDHGENFDPTTAVNTGAGLDHSNSAGALDISGGMGGPLALLIQSLFPLPHDNGGISFPESMKMFKFWENSPSPERAQIAHGEKLFNTRKFTVTRVAGLNDRLGRAQVAVTCSSCHNSPGSGGGLGNFPMDTGLNDVNRRPAGFPVYTVKCNTSGKIVQTTDIGRAMISGKCADISKMKVPVLRGLPGRSPYFHNGFATTERDIVEFYDSRFTIGFTNEEKEALAAFLQSI